MGTGSQRARPAGFTAIVLVALATARCSAFLDTDGLSGPLPSDAANEGGPDAARPPNADAADASIDAWSLPEGAVVWPTNGHAYLVVGAERIVWDVARIRANELGGHLVTIESSAENAFVFSLFETVEAAWLVEGNLQFGPWIGGFQTEGADEPDEGFRWVTNEPFVFTAWGSGEPSNGTPPEDVLHYFAGSVRGPEWNDTSVEFELPGYVVEFE